MIKTLLPLITRLPREHVDYLEKIFEDAPMWLSDCFSVKRLKKGDVFIHEETPVDKVYILLEGLVQAVDHRIFGIEYDYMQFQPIKLFGSMEILLEIEKYKTTLKAQTDCTLLVLKKEYYQKWIRKDINALLMETKAMGNYLLDQSRRERTFLFLNGMDRLFMIFTRNYEYYKAMRQKCVLTCTRQDLSNYSGLSVKTINRAVKKMEEDNYIGRAGNKILISAEQYQRMKTYLDSIIS